MDNLDTKRFIFFDRIKKFISFEPLKKQAPKNWRNLRNVVFFYPLFLVVIFLPTLYFASSFGDGSHIRITHGKLGYVTLGKPNSNNFIVYPNDGSKSIGGYSSKPCGNFLKQTVLQYQGNSVTALYQNNAIYQLTFESSNQLIIPECNIQNNKVIYKHLTIKYIGYLLSIIIFTWLYVYMMNLVIYENKFKFYVGKSYRIRMTKASLLYLFLTLTSVFYFGRNFTTLIELIFGSFK